MTQLIAPLQNIDQKHILDIRKEIDFYRSTPQILITTDIGEYVEWFRELAKEYLGFDVNFVGFRESGLKEIRHPTDENPIEIAFAYYKTWQAPILLLVFSEADEVEIVPVKSLSVEKHLVLFGTWTNTKMKKTSMERWFFESISNKYFWQEITGDYGYPPPEPIYKDYLKQLIAKAM